MKLSALSGLHALSQCLSFPSDTFFGAVWDFSKTFISFSACWHFFMSPKCVPRIEMDADARSVLLKSRQPRPLACHMQARKYIWLKGGISAIE